MNPRNNNNDDRRGPRRGQHPEHPFGPGHHGRGPRPEPGNDAPPHERGPRGERGRGARRGFGRAPRGDVRAAVLTLLAERGMHGYQLMQEIAERSAGRWTPSPGAIYPTLAQLADEGLIALAEADGRKLATLTEAGSAFVEAARASGVDPFAAFAQDADGPDLPLAIRELVDAVRHAAHSASAQQQTAIAELLSETRRSIYRLLADGPASAVPVVPMVPDVPVVPDLPLDPQA